MEQALTYDRRSAVGEASDGPAQNQSPMRIVMGIDPGLANTGFGVVRVAGSRMTAIDGGTIEVAADMAAEQRLRRIHDSVC